MDMSGLSWYDRVCLIAQYNMQFNKDKFTSDAELRKRGFNDKAIEMLKEAQKSNRAKSLESCGIRFKSDFSHLKHPDFYFIYELFTCYKLGNLPFSGGSAEQPAQVMEILQLISLLEIERENNANKQASKK